MLEAAPINLNEDEPGTATQGMIDASVDSMRHRDGISKENYDMDQEMMLISSLSPMKGVNNTLRAPNVAESQNSQQALNLGTLSKPVVEDPKVNQRFSKPQVAEVVVKNADARSMIPIQQHEDAAYKDRSPKQKTRRFGKLQSIHQPQPANSNANNGNETRSKSPARKSPATLNNDLQMFH